MPSYRFFKIEDGRRGPGEWLEAAHDDEAMRIARQWCRDARGEVWLQRRLIGVVATQA
jgi:hypothetical protein